MGTDWPKSLDRSNCGIVTTRRDGKQATASMLRCDPFASETDQEGSGSAIRAPSRGPRLWSGNVHEVAGRRYLKVYGTSDSTLARLPPGIGNHGMNYQVMSRNF